MVDIKRALPDDAESVISLLNRLLEELGGEPIPIEDAQSALLRLVADPAAGFALLAIEEKSIVGICTVSFQEAVRARGRYALIQEMYVVPQFRSRGVGAALVEEAVSQARSLGCRTVEVGTPAGGDRQEAFYQRLGFAPVGLRLRRPTL